MGLEFQNKSKPSLIIIFFPNLGCFPLFFEKKTLKLTNISYTDTILKLLGKFCFFIFSIKLRISIGCITLQTIATSIYETHIPCQYIFCISFKIISSSIFLLKCFILSRQFAVSWVHQTLQGSNPQSTRPRKDHRGFSQLSSFRMY